MSTVDEEEIKMIQNTFRGVPSIFKARCASNLNPPFLEKININKIFRIDGCCSPRRKLLLQKPLPYKYHRDSYVRVCHSK